MGSITTWTRLEPQIRDDSLPGLAARVADPLFLLARQWQTGELDGSDAATPIAVHVVHEEAPITQWAKGTARSRPAKYPAGTPLEAVVNAVRPVASLRDRARGGQKFLALLGTTLAAAHKPDLLADGYGVQAPATPVDTDTTNAQWMRVIVGRELDGQALRAAMGNRSGTLPAAFAASFHSASQADKTAISKAADAFRKWWDSRFKPTEGAWQSQRLGAPFRLGGSSASGAITMVAPDHRGGSINWTAFDLLTPATVGGSTTATPTTTTVLPTRATYPGMPATRWWQFEDATVDVGQITAGPDDLARLLMAEFALIYGNDFFVAPLSVPVGSVSRIVEITVDTNFGETITVPSTITVDGGAKASWRLFHCTAATQKAFREEGLLVIPHSAIAPLTGPAVEDVLLTRDEMANVAWAIERHVRGPAGPTVDRSSVAQASDPNPSGTGAGTRLTYVLSTTVPDSWLPLTATTRGTLETAGTQPRLGQLMGGGRKFVIDDAELPRGGRLVACQATRVRAADGRPFTWWGWTSGPGRGESSSGLTFDTLANQ
jgi:hypothetical protein